LGEMYLYEIYLTNVKMIFLLLAVAVSLVIVFFMLLTGSKDTDTENLRTNNENDCTGVWGPWSACVATSCGVETTQTRSFQTTNTAKDGGAPCIYENVTQTNNCTVIPCSDVIETDNDCVLGQWYDTATGPHGCQPLDSACDETHLNYKKGTKIQHRDIQTAATGDGTCPQLLDQTTECTFDLCPPTLPGRSATLPPATLPPATLPPATLPKSINCVVRWNEWSDCTKPCGGGTTTQTYEVITHPAHGGANCPDEQTITCNSETRPIPVDCVGGWADVTECSQPCGGGTKPKPIE
jgi:hypothetical protein